MLVKRCVLANPNHRQSLHLGMHHWLAEQAKLGDNIGLCQAEHAALRSQPRLRWVTLLWDSLYADAVQGDQWQQDGGPSTPRVQHDDPVQLPAKAAACVRQL